MKGYYHVCSDGLRKNDIFKNNEDFIAGMNDIGLCILAYDIKILCFCLMSNHFHFVLYGKHQECLRFSEEYKRRCAMRMRKKSSEVKALKKVGIQMYIVDNSEYLENVIVYVLRNPIAGGIFTMPYHYKWSSISLYYNAERMNEGEYLNDMSERKRFRILKSRVVVPDHYQVDASGMIIPSCYVDFGTVERIFRHPARLLMLIGRKVESDVEVMLGIADNVTMTDQEILTQMNDLIIKEFNKDSITLLSMEQRIKLCVLLKRNFKAGVKQIARITRLEPDVVAKVI